MLAFGSELWRVNSSWVC